MRIERIDLYGWGPFAPKTEIALNSESGKLHLLFGENEAGKSSLLRGVLAWWFGIDSPAQDAHRHEQGQLLVGGSLRNAAGVAWSSYRRSGRRGHTLLDADAKTKIPEARLESWLNHLTREDFLALYGLNHEGLRAGADRLLEAASADDRILATGRLAALKVRLGRLQIACDQLYRPRGSQPPLNRLLAEIRSAKEQYRKASLSPESFAELEQTALSEEAQLLAIEENLARVAGRLEELTTLAMVAPWVQEMDEQLALRAQLGEIRAFADDAKIRYQEFREKSILLRQREEQIQAEILRLNAALLDLGIQSQAIRPEAIVELRELLSKAREASGAMKTRTQDLTATQAEIAALLAESPLPTIELSGPDFGALLVDTETAIKARANAESALAAAAAEHDESLRHFALLQAERMAFGERPALAKLETLRACLSAAKTAAIAQQAERADEIRQVQSKEALKLRICDSFAGDPLDFATLKLPSHAEALEHQQLGERLRERLELAQKREEELTQDHEALTKRRKEFGAIDRALLESVWERAQGERDRILLDALQPGSDWRALLLQLQQSIRDADAAATLYVKALESGAAALAIDLQLESLAQQLEAARRSSEEARARALTHEAEDQARYGVLGTHNLSLSRRLELSLALQEARRLRAEMLATEEQQRRRAEDATRTSAELHEAVVALGYSESTAVTPRDLIAQSIQCVEEIETRIREAQRLEAELNEARRACARKEVDRQLKETARAAHQQDLTERLHRLGQNPAEGEFALLAKIARWRKIVALQQRAREHQREIESLQCHFQRLGDALEPDASEREDPHGLLAFAEAEIRRMEREEQRAKEREDLLCAKNALEVEAKELREEQARAEALAERIAPGASQEAPDEVLEAIARRDRAAELESRIERLKERLRSTLPGRSLTDIRELLRQITLDHLTPAHLAAQKTRVDELRKERDEARRALDAARLALREAEASKAPQLIADFARAQAEAEPHLLRYVAMKAAAHLIEERLERELEGATLPILGIAKELIPRLTAGRYQDLRLDWSAERSAFDELVAVSASGIRRRLEDLSDGTRDQVFLALRLAHILRRLEDHESLPVLLDDILIQTDEKRAHATLELLGELSDRVQILLFTHSARILELAERAIPTERLEIISLDGRSA